MDISEPCLDLHNLDHGCHEDGKLTGGNTLTEGLYNIDEIQLPGFTR